MYNKFFGPSSRIQSYGAKLNVRVCMYIIIYSVHFSNEWKLKTYVELLFAQANAVAIFVGWVLDRTFLDMDLESSRRTARDEWCILSLAYMVNNFDAFELILYFYNYYYFSSWLIFIIRFRYRNQVAWRKVGCGSSLLCAISSCSYTIYLKIGKVQLLASFDFIRVNILIEWPWPL